MADEYQSGVIDLSGGPVTKIQTSSSNPDVVMDSTGLYATDANGNILFKLDALLGSALLRGGINLPLNPTGFPIVPSPSNVIEWVDVGSGAVFAKIVGSQGGGGVDVLVESEGGVAAGHNWDEGSVTLNAKSSGALGAQGTASLKLDARDAANPAVGTASLTATAQGSAGGSVVQTKRVLDESGNSDFLQAPAGYNNPARLFNVNYQPNTSHTTFVIANMGSGGAGAVQCDVYIGATVLTMNRICTFGNLAGSGWVPASFIVPAGWFYQLVNGTASPPASIIDSVHEFRL